jgi:chaperonin GroES
LLAVWPTAVQDALMVGHVLATIQSMNVRPLAHQVRPKASKSRLRTTEGSSSVASKIRPVGDRLVVKPAAKEEITRSGIVIPDTAKEKPQEGEVIAVGSGKLLDNGDRVPMEIKVGDRVLYAKYGGTEFKLDGEDYLVMRETDVLAVLVKE